MEGSGEGRDARRRFGAGRSMVRTRGSTIQVWNATVAVRYSTAVLMTKAMVSKARRED